jgi:RNA polymerase sigma-70 factor (ECF subfamily)
MGTSGPKSSSEILRLLHCAAGGDQEAWGELFMQHRQRLLCMVALRMDRRLQGRVDASDVLQEAYLQAFLNVSNYLKSPDIPFFLWLRLITGQRLLALQRHHLGVHARDAGREVALYRGSLPEASSAALAEHLLGRGTSPSQAALRAERAIHLQDALNSLEPLDREILVLRHFEQLTNAEAAQVLEIRESAASKRYTRALMRLKYILSNLPGGFQELWK